MRELRLTVDISHLYVERIFGTGPERVRLFTQLQQTLCMILASDIWGKSAIMSPLTFGEPVFWHGMKLPNLDMMDKTPWIIPMELRKIPVPHFEERKRKALITLTEVDIRVHGFLFEEEILDDTGETERAAKRD